MKIINNTDFDITLTDIDRGIPDSNLTSDIWNAKSACSIPAGCHIHVLDTERVMLSTEMGQIGKWVSNGALLTQHSITGTVAGPYAFSGANNTFIFSLDGTVHTVSLPTGACVTTADVVSALNSSLAGASGFIAENSEFFRYQNMSPMDNELAEGALGTGYGVRTPSVLTGFLSLAADVIITIGAGSANATLGFHSGDFTKSQ